MVRGSSLTLGIRFVVDGILEDWVGGCGFRRLGRGGGANSASLASRLRIGQVGRGS